jgi:hypothetical protein
MPIHDWTRVDAGVFHAFHHGWIEEIARALNREILPPSYYALPEQHAAGFGPDVLTLQGQAEDDYAPNPSPAGTGTVLLAPPKLQPVAETDMGFYRRKQKTVTVRHVSGDRIVAVVEIVSPGNKAGRRPLRSLVAKAGELLDRQIHLLIVDLLPRGPRDPEGIHGEIWQEIAGQNYTAPRDKPFTLAAYESGLTVRAYVVAVGLGETLTDMPLFLEPEQAVQVPLEKTYMAAFTETPRRWRRVLEPAES